MHKSPKKPFIFFLVILPVFGGGAASIVSALVTAYARMAAVPMSSVPNLNGLLISLPTIFLWIPVALLLSNCVLFAVPPLRRIAEAYVARSGRPGFAESQRQLGKVALIMALFCVPLIALGFLL
jgi:hypothetical protein